MGDEEVGREGEGDGRWGGGEEAEGSWTLFRINPSDDANEPLSRLMPMNRSHDANEPLSLDANEPLSYVVCRAIIEILLRTQANSGSRNYHRSERPCRSRLSTTN